MPVAAGSSYHDNKPSMKGIMQGFDIKEAEQSEGHQIVSAEEVFDKAVAAIETAGEGVLAIQVNSGYSDPSRVQVSICLFAEWATSFVPFVSKLDKTCLRSRTCLIF